MITLPGDGCALTGRETSRTRRTDPDHRSNLSKESDMRIALTLAAALATTAQISATAQADDSTRFVPGIWEIRVHSRITGPIELDDVVEESAECLASAEELMGSNMGDDCTITGREVGSEGGWATFNCTYDTDGMHSKATGRMDVVFKGEHSDGTMSMRMSTPLGDLDVDGSITARRVNDC
ncbi:DUF3617 family protein [Rehaibacterium terrae]|uniref:DUF3617 family protein n=1 Tax=Rehaibacterium terrae TaxID=1341696 RepID=A0A7W7Y023_9GAMM|nr:DUF3617 family protein [Rehaibacterium terrae]MBB5015433.1 hypothetical protein [Rehaibacterium terrae]